MSAASSHISVLLHEAVAALAVGQRQGGVFVDATFGRGGHSREILRQLSPCGRLVALDRDADAVTAGQALAAADGRFSIHHYAFSALAELLDGLGIRSVDGVLLDLGVSSAQLADLERGMSFRHDAPLDMRMDTRFGQTAAEFLANADLTEIERVIKDYGEERFAYAIAKTLVAARRTARITRSGQLAALVAQAVRTREAGQHPATRTFQALRIHVNAELAELKRVLPQAIERLNGGGRLTVIAFHSLEDRIVKQFMRQAATPAQPPRGIPLRSAELAPPALKLIGKPIRPGAEEIAVNPRSRSAILRTAEKL